MLKLKSKLLNSVSYTDIDISENLPDFTPDREKLEKDVKRVFYSHGESIQADTVNQGDLVKLSCESDNPIFSRKDIWVSVGKNLWNSTFEKKLVGLKKGVPTEIVVDGTKISVTVSDIVRTKIPAMNDENAARLGIEGVSTLDELKKNCLKKQISRYLNENEEADEFVNSVARRVGENGVFEFDEGEIESTKKTIGFQFEQAKLLRQQMIERGDIDPDEEWEIDSMFDSLVETTMQTAVIGYNTLLRGDNMVPDEEDYEDEIRNRALQAGVSTEQYREIYNETDYLIEMCSGFFFDSVEKYVLEAMTDAVHKKLTSRPDVYDVAIVGAGPAGLSAALTLKVHNKSIIWFGTDKLSNKVEKSEKIANYAGFEPISGEELNEKFRTQIKSSGLELTDRMVTAVSKSGDSFMILADNQIYKAKTVLLTVGSVPPKGFENENELLGRGVSYCATCDGFLYKNKTIAVYCGDKRFEHEVEYLAELADKVYLYTPYKNADISAQNIIRLEKPIKAVLGEEKAGGIRLSDDSVVELDGVFVLRNAVAPAKILSGLETDGAHIVVDRMAKTNIAGVFAAGDCTGRPYQIAKAVGEGNVAAHSIVEYLAG